MQPPSNFKHRKIQKVSSANEPEKMIFKVKNQEYPTAFSSVFEPSLLRKCRVLLPHQKFIPWNSTIFLGLLIQWGDCLKTRWKKQVRYRNFISHVSHASHASFIASLRCTSRLQDFGWECLFCGENKFFSTKQPVTTHTTSPWLKTQCARYVTYVKLCILSYHEWILANGFGLHTGYNLNIIEKPHNQ